MEKTKEVVAYDLTLNATSSAALQLTDRLIPTHDGPLTTTSCDVQVHVAPVAFNCGSPKPGHDS